MTNYKITYYLYRQMCFWISLAFLIALESKAGKMLYKLKYSKQFRLCCLLFRFMKTALLFRTNLFCHMLLNKKKVTAHTGDRNSPVILADYSWNGHFSFIERKLGMPRKCIETQYISETTTLIINYDVLRLDKGTRWSRNTAGLDDWSKQSSICDWLGLIDKALFAICFNGSRHFLRIHAI